MYDIVIVGAGPAGLTGAIYGARGGQKVALVEKLSYGGQIINTPEVENYPGSKDISGFELANAMHEQAVSLGAELLYGEVTGVEKISDSKPPYFNVKLSGKDDPIKGKSVIIAVGLKQRQAGLEKEELLVGKGISYCATCDGGFFKGKDVAVLGGGNTALEDAEYMAGLANQVYLIHRRDEFRGDAIQVERLKKIYNVEIILNSVTKEIIGESSVNGLRIEDVNTHEERVIDVSAAFIAYGHIPVNDEFSPMADLDNTGFFLSGEDCKTKTPGLFVAGDCREKTRRQLVTATSDGAISAMNAIEYIHNLG